MGDPRLLQPAEAVTAFATPALDHLVADLTDPLRAMNGVGLAAPQIGVPLQVVIFEVKDNPRHPKAEPVPFTVLINPERIPLSDELEEGWEGC